MNMNGYEHSMKMDETAKNGRTLKDLNLTDDFLFDVTTENLENCKYIIELSLGIELKDLRWKENQKVIQKLHVNVQIIKDSAEMEAEFMKAEERERQIRDEGVKEGIKEGMKEYDRFMKLTQKLLSDKQYDELKRATEEKSYCQQLFEKYNII